MTAPLETIIKEMEERYMHTTPSDTLVCEFHQLHQDKKERVKEFAGRIEKLFKKLVDQLPERYPDRSLLKDRLFYGMQQHLRDSLGLCFRILNAIIHSYLKQLALQRSKVKEEGH